MEGNKFRYAILLLAIFIVLIMVGKANAQPYSQVSIFDNVTQSSNFYSYSMVQYTLTLYNTSSSASGYIYKTRYKKSTTKKTKKKTNKNFVLSLLKPDEKAVLSAIDRKGFTYQADIIKKTGFSKIKVSKILTKLTNYKLLKIKQEGRVNKVKRL